MKIEVKQFVDNSETETEIFETQQSFIDFIIDQITDIPTEINSVSFEITITK